MAGRATAPASPPLRAMDEKRAFAAGQNIGPEHADFLRDESRLTGRAERICFPAGEEEASALLAELSASGVPVTVQGAKTGISGGAVPFGGSILNLSRMTRILRVRCDGGRFFLAVQPGVLLQEVDELLDRGEPPAKGWDDVSARSFKALREAGRHLFLPDPTERSASIGGMAATNASGARGYRYGQMRAHLRSLRVLLADGSAVELRRGEQRASGRAFRVTTETGRTIEGSLPLYRMPPVKNAAGYFVEDDMDLLDLFVGSEGTLGVFTEIEVVLSPEPAVIWGIMVFLPSDKSLAPFLQATRRPPAQRGGSPLAAVEYFDANTLRLLAAERDGNPAIAALPVLPQTDGPAIYLEYHASEETAAEGAVEEMTEALARSGGRPEKSWFASSRPEVQRLKSFRHALPEVVNRAIDERRKADPAISKLGTDMAVPDGHLEEALSMYDEDLRKAGLQYVKFGHIGDCHVHVNVLPESRARYDEGRALYRQWARRVVAAGGTVSAEHGIGKLKRELLAMMYGEAGIREMLDLKRCFDPAFLLGRGTMFEPPS